MHTLSAGGQKTWNLPERKIFAPLEQPRLILPSSEKYLPICEGDIRGVQKVIAPLFPHHRKKIMKRKCMNVYLIISGMNVHNPPHVEKPSVHTQTLLLHLSLKKTEEQEKVGFSCPFLMWLENNLHLGKWWICDPWKDIGVPWTANKYWLIVRTLCLDHRSVKAVKRRRKERKKNGRLEGAGCLHPYTSWPS